MKGGLYGHFCTSYPVWGQIPAGASDNLETDCIFFAIAFLIGILITVIRVCPIRPLQLFGDFYVQIFRNIPGAALLILLVYALPYLNIILSYYTCVLIATSLIPSAFCSEYLMAGMNTIAPGQIEAAVHLACPFQRS